MDCTGNIKTGCVKWLGYAGKLTYGMYSRWAILVKLTQGINSRSTTLVKLTYVCIVGRLYG